MAIDEKEKLETQETPVEQVTDVQAAATQQEVIPVVQVQENDQAVEAPASDEQEAAPAETAIESSVAELKEKVEKVIGILETQAAKDAEIAGQFVTGELQEIEQSVVSKYGPKVWEFIKGVALAAIIYHIFF